MTPLDWPRTRAAGLSLRPFADDDLPFLFTVYAAGRWAELAHVPWSDEQKLGFLSQQAAAQHAHYQATYEGAHWWVVENGAERVGRLYLVRWTGELRVIDIALLPRFIGQGLGSALIGDLIEQAAAETRAVTLHVEKNNPAQRLYARLGFKGAGEHGVYDLLRLDPPLR